MWEDLLRALALVMIIEGLMPFLAPERWREMIRRVTTVNTRGLRIFGGVLIAVGLVSLHLLRGT